ncbi:hypothetical protein P3S67_009225 [Capsicum chacoense]|uniref:uncharacterized protein LOC107875579 n=1 Tax=Capsicum annuum TaxID=4072 RepID=UPI0007BF68D9|nr:uncharacterized protein LOC107875579 [Capsicum annuum]KAF3677601.1 Gar1 RNA-binding region family protein [Capsicum annuum]
MCPLRFVLVFFSAILAGYFAWKTVRSFPDDQENEDSVHKSKEEKREFNSAKVNFTHMISNGFWVFVDMASGKYLWRNLKSLHNEKSY